MQKLRIQQQSNLTKMYKKQQECIRYLKTQYYECYYSNCQICFNNKANYCKDGLFVLKIQNYKTTFVLCDRNKENKIQMIILSAKNKQIQMKNINGIYVDKEKVFRFVHNNNKNEKREEDRIKFDSCNILSLWKNKINQLQYKLPVKWDKNSNAVKIQEKPSKLKIKETGRTSYTQCQNQNIKQCKYQPTSLSSDKSERCTINKQVITHKYEPLRQSYSTKYQAGPQNLYLVYEKDQFIKQQKENEKKLQSLQLMLQIAQDERNKQKQRNNKLQQQLSILNDKIKEGILQKDKLNKEKIALQIKNDQKMINIQLLSKKYETQIQNNNKLKQKNQQIYNNKIFLQQKIKNLEQLNKKLRQKVQQQQNFTFLQLQMKIQQKDQQIQAFDRHIKDLHLIIKGLQQKIQYHKCKQQDLIQKMKAAPQQKLSLVSQIQNHEDYYHIFQGKILEQQISHKQYLRQQIQVLNGRKMLKSKIIYEFDSLNKANFHNYIDEISDIVLIVKTKAGYIFAGYSQSPISSRSVASSNGFIASLSNRQVFHCLKDKKTVCYDDYYIIFGKAEIRLKFLQRKVFSNFGIGNASYQSNNHKVDILFGEGNNKQVQLEHFQVHKIYYK